MVGQRVPCGSSMAVAQSFKPPEQRSGTAACAGSPTALPPARRCRGGGLPGVPPPLRGPHQPGVKHDRQRQGEQRVCLGCIGGTARGLHTAVQGDSLRRSLPGCCAPPWPAGKAFYHDGACHPDGNTGEGCMLKRCGLPVPVLERAMGLTPPSPFQQSKPSLRGAGLRVMGELAAKVGCPPQPGC